MPFDGEFDNVFEGLIKPALTTSGYVVGRADKTLDQQNVIRDIVQGIASADLVVADVTGLNGNVMYELGLAHGLGRPTVILTQALEEVPFDLRSYRVQEYSTHFKDADRLRTDLSAIADGLTAGNLSFGSPVTDFAGPQTRGLSGASATRATPIGGNDVEPDRRSEWLDDYQEFVESGTVFGTAFTTLTAETAAVGEKIAAQTARLGELNSAEPGAATARQYRNIALRAAAILNEYADRLEEVLPDAESAADTILNSGSAFVEGVRAGQDPAEAEQLRTTATELLEAVRASMAQGSEFRESILQLRGISAPLTSSANRVGKTLDRVIKVGERIESFAERVTSLLDDPEV